MRNKSSHWLFAAHNHVIGINIANSSDDYLRNADVIAGNTIHYQLCNFKSQYHPSRNIFLQSLLLSLSSHFCLVNFKAKISKLLQQIIDQQMQYFLHQKTNKFYERIYFDICQNKTYCCIFIALKCNNFNLALMSASLPRIRTIAQMSKPAEENKDLKVKFRRLTLYEGENAPERKKSIKSIQSSRLNSLERYTTVEEQRQLKNEKIHLNLIERKLMTGTYDEKIQTSNSLNVLKHRRDQLRVQMLTKQKQTQRIKSLLQDTRSQIEQFLSKQGEHQQRLRDIRSRSDAQNLRTESAREYRNVLQNMILARQEINMVFAKRHFGYKDEIDSFRNGLTLLDVELREVSERCAAQENQLEALLVHSNQERQTRNEQIAKHQQKINKRKEGEVHQAEKSKKYIAFLDDVQRQAQIKDFRSVYDKILANLFVARYAKNKMLDLKEYYDKYESAYAVVSSYRSFDQNNPRTLCKRYFEHSTELGELQKGIQAKESLQAGLESSNKTLRKALEAINGESDQMSESILQNSSSVYSQQQRRRIAELKEQCEELQQKGVRVKSNILKMLQGLNQKGEKKIYSGLQATVTNLTLLSKVLREGFRRAV